MERAPDAAAAPGGNGHRRRQLEALYEELAAYPGIERETPHTELAGAEILVPLRLRGEDGELAFFSTLSTFGTAVDITLAELSIEAFYPANAQTAIRLLRHIDATVAG